MKLCFLIQSVSFTSYTEDEFAYFFNVPKVLKHEVELMSKMAKTIDGFTQNQTRMAVIIDGLDACEQDRVLQMLDTVCVFTRFSAASSRLPLG